MHELRKAVLQPVLDFTELRNALPNLLYREIERVIECWFVANHADH
jgi:hypothetical protein